MDMNKTCMIIIGAVGGVALLAILAAIAFCIAFVIFYRKAVNAGVVPGVARVVTPVEKKAIAANNAIVVEWKLKALALRGPFADFIYRGKRANANQLDRSLLDGQVGIVFGDIETIRIQNSALTSSNISAVLGTWLQYGPGGKNAIAANVAGFKAKINDFLAIDAVKQAVIGLPASQVSNLVNALADLSNVPRLHRLNAVNLFNANFALTSADNLLFALRFANNASFCTIGVSEFDNNMKTVDANLTQVHSLLSEVRNAYNLTSETYHIYGDNPAEVLTYNKRSAEATPSATSPTAASSSESLPTPQQQQPSS